MTAMTVQKAGGKLEDAAAVREMLKLAAPMIITTISFTLMQFVDRFMVSRLGTTALAAILPAGIVSFVPAGFAIGVLTSVTTYVSQSLGMSRFRDCSHYCWQAIFMGLAYSLVVAAVMWPSAPWIFKWMGHQQEVALMEVVYLRIMLYCQVLAVFIWAPGQFFMGIHRPVITMYAALCGQCVNVAANYVLIFGKMGFPAMGIAGAAWGTFIGVAVGGAIRTGLFLTGTTAMKFQSRKTMQIDWAKMRDLLKVGLPVGFELMTNVAFWGVILYSLVAGFGKEAMAATSAVLCCTDVSIMPIVGIGTALTAAVGKAIGQNSKYTAVKQTAICLKISLAYMAAVGFCFVIFRTSLMTFWSSDDNVIALGKKILLWAAFYQIFYAARIIYSGALRGAGDTVYLAITSAIGSALVLGVGGLTIMKTLPQLGAVGPWIAATAGIVAISLANTLRFKSNRWMRIELFKRLPVGVPVEIDTAAE